MTEEKSAWPKPLAEKGELEMAADRLEYMLLQAENHLLKGYVLYLENMHDPEFLRKLAEGVREDGAHPHLKDMADALERTPPDHDKVRDCFRAVMKRIRE